MSDTIYSVLKRTSPDGKLTQFGILDQGYFIALAEFPAASLQARQDQWNKLNPQPSPAGDVQQAPPADSSVPVAQV